MAVGTAIRIQAIPHSKKSKTAIALLSAAENKKSRKIENPTSEIKTFRTRHSDFRICYYS